LDKNEAYRQILQLHNDLSRIVERDGEQEVRSIALPVLDAVVAAAKELLPPDHPVVRSASDVISMESIETGEPLRAVDVLIVVGQLMEALRPPPARAKVTSPDRYPPRR
jgi:hypothetical protein